MASKRGLAAPLLFVIVPALVLAGTLAAPAFASTRTTTNTCAGCHGGIYNMYLTVTSYYIPGSMSEADSNIYCNISITGNMDARTSYWLSTITVTASSANGCVGFKNNPKSFSNILPGATPAAVIQGYGIKSGSDTITLKATISPNHQTASCVRWESKTGAVLVTINAPPDLTGGKVTPASGNISNTYAFEVNYTDAEGDAPAYVRCYVDAVPYTMTVKDGVMDTLTTKETFIATVPGSSIGVGTNHHYNFSSADAKHAAKGDTSSHSGPDILGENPPTCQILEPSSGSYGGDLNVSGSAQDDPWDTMDAVYVSFTSGLWLLANGTTSWYIVANLSLYPDGLMNISAKAVTGAVESAPDTLSITVDHSLKNAAPALSFDLAQGSIVTGKIWINGSVTDTDLPLQALVVKVGVGSPPTLPANVTGGGPTRAWSFMVDLSDLSEGKTAIYARAWDDYTSSPQMKLDLFVNWPPLLDLDPLPVKVWGVYEFAGNVVDEESALNVSLSFDNGTEYPANVSDGRWSIQLDVTKLAEAAHVLRVVADDGNAKAMLEAPVNVGGPWGRPIYLFSSPENVTVSCPGCSFTCMVKYMDGDHRGTMVNWYLDGALVREDEGNGTSLMSVSGGELGTMLVKVVVFNKADPDLDLVVEWTIEVKAELTISPVGPTDIEATVGEVVLLRFTVTEGACTSVVWTQDGSEIDGEYFVYFLPQEEGVTEFKVVAYDDYGNSASVQFNVTASPGDATVEPPPEEQGLSPLSSIVIGCLAILLVLAMIYTVFAMVRSRSKKAPVAQAPAPQPKPTPAPPVQQPPQSRYSWGAPQSAQAPPPQANPQLAVQHPEEEFPTAEDFGPPEAAVSDSPLEVLPLEPEALPEGDAQNEAGGEEDDSLESF